MFNLQKSILIILYLTVLNLFDLVSQQRLEIFQWYTNEGGNDAFEIKLFNSDNDRLFYSAHGDVIDSYSPYFPNLSTYYPEDDSYSYLIEPIKKDSFIKIAETIIISENEVPLFKNISTAILEDNYETYQYDLTKSANIAYYTTEIDHDGKMHRTWYDLKTMNVVGTLSYSETFKNCIFFYKYDLKNRIVYEVILRNGIIIRKKRIIYFN